MSNRGRLYLASKDDSNCPACLHPRDEGSKNFLGDLLQASTLFLLSRHFIWLGGKDSHLLLQGIGGQLGLPVLLHFDRPLLLVQLLSRLKAQRERISNFANAGAMGKRSATHPFLLLGLLLRPMEGHRQQLLPQGIIMRVHRSSMQTHPLSYRLV